MRIALLGFLAAAGILLTATAGAHGGHESETEVRVFAGRMRVVVRGSLPFAWRMLGDRAPAAADEAGKAVAQPLLAAAGAELFEITAGGEPMTPLKTDCLFESHDLHDHAAFTLDFERPDAWPVTIEATFFPKLGELDSGSIAVFDHTASRFSRDVEPLVRKAISGTDAALTFDLSPPAVSGTPPATVPEVPAPDTPSSPRGGWLLPAILIGALLAGLVAFAATRRS